jgi:hypothetical protein
MMRDRRSTETVLMTPAITNDRAAMGARLRWALLATALLDLAAVSWFGVICVSADERRTGVFEDSPASAAPTDCRKLDESSPVPAVECEMLQAMRRAALARAWM